MWYVYVLLAFIIWLLYIKLITKEYKRYGLMKNKVVIVTGANTGLGFETAKDLARRGARVIMACRSHDTGSAARDYIVRETGNNDVHLKILDLCSFESVRKFAKEINESETRLDVLINNAGISTFENKLTEDNLPIMLQVNYVSPFLLTKLLLPLLKSSGPSRIINVSSIMHRYGSIDLSFEKKSNGFIQSLLYYGDTKLMMILFTRELAKRLEGTGVTANSLYPGHAGTHIYRHYPLIVQLILNIVFLSPWDGAQTSLYLAVEPRVTDVSGKYFVNLEETAVSKSAMDDSLATKLWDRTESIIAK